MGLKSNFHAYFPDTDPQTEWVGSPSATCNTKLSSSQEHSLSNLTSYIILKSEALYKKSLTNLLLHVRSEFPALVEISAEYLMPFATTYICEIAFPVTVDVKSKKRHHLEVKDDMRMKISVVRPTNHGWCHHRIHAIFLIKLSTQKT
jgi:hypothetical protein